MALILNIDTATENASVAVCSNGNVLAISTSNQQKEHAAFVHVAIQQILQQLNLNIEQLDAVAVTGGPGSYTGLRVAMAAAKGLCYALNKPLITVNTLQVMAQAAKKKLDENKISYGPQMILVPMIDARRMDVFTARYNMELTAITQPAAVELSSQLVEELDKPGAFLCFGDGSSKILNIKSDFKTLLPVSFSAANLGELAETQYETCKFDDTVYAEPQYFKEFYTIARKI